jgi:Flp pilus assembly protein TadD
MRIHFSLERADSAAAAAARLLALEPRSEEGWRVLALCRARLHDYSAALSAAGRWAELSAESLDPLLLGMSLCRELGLDAQGLALARRARGLAPADGGVLLEYASFLDATGQTAEMEALIQAHLRQAPEDAAALNFLGYTWVERGVRLDEAAALIEQALRLQPENPAFLDSMGWLWYKKGRPDRAESYLETAAAKGGRHPEIYRHLAIVRLERGHPAAAREALEAGLTLYPGDSTLASMRRDLEAQE